MIKKGRRIKAWIITLIIATTGFGSRAQEVLLHGLVKDSATGAPLTNASISIKGLRGGARTNSEGRFKIPAGQQSVDVTITIVGYNSRTIHLDSVPSEEIVVSLGRK